MVATRIWPSLLAQWEVQNQGWQIGALEFLDDARAFGVVFGDIFNPSISVASDKNF